MRRFWFLALILLTITPALVGQTDCTTFNTTISPSPYGNYDRTEHITGEHFWTDAPSGSCAYSGQAEYSASVGCNLLATANSGIIAADNGELDTIIDEHFVNYSHAAGQNDASNGGSADADTEGAVAARSCSPLGCSTAISFTGSGQGVGFGVTFTPANPMWEDKYYYKQSCAGETLPALPEPVSTCLAPTSPPPDGTGDWTWDSVNCTWEWTGPCGGGGCSPIVIDTSHRGFAFSDPKKGHYVTFDLRGDGNYEKVSWPMAGSGNAWLVYDRDGDGVIKDGSEMFGNFTPNSGWTNPNLSVMDRNGFIALGWYDQPAQGGNQNAVLDKDDAIWGKLRLWIDTHCYVTPDVPCQSRPNELHTLDSMGIYSISLMYQYDPNNRDKDGNWFKFYAYVNPDIMDAPFDKHHRHVGPDGTLCCRYHMQSKDGRRAYDVFLASVP